MQFSRVFTETLTSLNPCKDAINLNEFVRSHIRLLVGKCYKNLIITEIKDENIRPLNKTLVYLPTDPDGAANIDIEFRANVLQYIRGMIITNAKLIDIRSDGNMNK